MKRSQLFLFAFVAMPLLRNVSGVDEDPNLCGISVVECPGGCWNANGTVAVNGTRLCEPVMAGFASPFRNDERVACEPGYFTDTDYAYYCEPCNFGEYSPTEASTFCRLCPPGTFNPYILAHGCFECDPGLYSGSGSDYTVVLGGIRYCLPPRSHLFDSESPSSAPSDAPSVVPSLAPTSAPSETPSFSPSLVPTTTSSPTMLSASSDVTPSPSQALEDPTENPPPRDNKGKKETFQGLESWQYVLLFAGLCLIALLIKRYRTERQQQAALAARPKPGPPGGAPKDEDDGYETTMSSVVGAERHHQDDGDKESLSGTTHVPNV